jgi:phage baseplate assembly protein W
MAERAQLFGTDLQVAERVTGFDTVSSPRGDLQLVAGNDNIIQALTLRLLVRRGELAPLGWPDYGSRLHELIGEPNNTRTHLRLMAFARTAVEQDPRVLEVTSVQTEVLPGEPFTVRLILEITLIDTPNPLNLVVTVPLEAS